MANTVRVFDFEIDVHGARVIAVREPIFPACLSGGEIDENIRLLKADLEAVAKRMKAAVLKQASEPVTFE